MNAVYCTQYGGPSVLEVREMPMPLVGDHQVLVKNYASSITRADTFLRRGEPKFGRLFLGLSKPKHPIVGTGFAGEIVAIGKAVTAFELGDRVYGETKLNFSANAEYVSVHIEKDVLRVIPANVSYEAAACMCDGVLTSYNFLIKLAKIEANQHVLINGASGALGVAAVQIAKLKGAKVSAVCSTKNHAWVKELGADVLIDYKKEDFCQHTNTYDVVYDAVGASAYAKAKKALKAKGLYLTPVLSASQIWSVFSSMTSDKKSIFAATGLEEAAVLNTYLQEIETWLKAGVLKVLVDKKYAINDIVQAHEYIDSARKKANVVLSFTA